MERQKPVIGIKSSNPHVHTCCTNVTVSFLLQMSLPNITLYMHQYSALYVYKYGSFLVLTV